MVSLSNHDDESMAYDTLRQAQGDTSGLFAISSVSHGLKICILHFAIKVSQFPIIPSIGLLAVA